MTIVDRGSLRGAMTHCDLALGSVMRGDDGGWAVVEMLEAASHAMALALAAGSMTRRAYAAAQAQLGQARNLARAQRTRAQLGAAANRLADAVRTAA